MREFQYIISRYLTNRENQKKYLAVLLALSVLVSFVVPLILMQPADSLTIDRSHLATQLSTATPGEPSTLEENNMLDITSANKWSAAMSSGGNEFYVAYVNDAGQLVESETTGFTTAQQSVDIEVAIEYQFTKDVRDMLPDTGPHLGWYLGNSSLTADFGDQQYGEIYDDVYNAAEGNDYPAGTYVIENGYIKITLTEDYLKYVNNGDGTLIGSLRFDGTLSSSSDDDGDQEFTMAGQTVIVDFPDRNAKATNKSAWVNTSNGTIEWTVTIDNSNKIDMTGYTLTDDMLESATSVTFNPSDPAVGTHSGSTISFTSETVNAQWITIKYVTPITEEQMELVEGAATNKATLSKGDKTYGEVSDTANFSNNPITVTKNGTPDYESGTYDDKINWTVTVQNNYGLPLTGYVIEDPKLTSDAKVSDGSTLTSLGNNKWQLNTTATSVTITYTTSAEEGKNDDGSGKNPNTAKVYYSKDDTTPARGGTTEQNVTYKTESELFTLDKTSTVNSDGTIQWKLTVNNSQYLNLAGYTLTDKMLASATEVNIPTVWYNNVNTSVAEYSDGTITFTEASKNLQWIEIYYKTEITKEQLQNVEGSKSNTVTFKNPDKDPIHTDVDTATFDKGDSFTVTKKANADYETSDYGGKINWTITISNPYGVSMDGYLIDDAEIPQNLNGVTISPSGTLTYDSTTGKYKISGTNAKTLTITYQTDATVGANNSNTASLYYPDNTTKADDGSDNLTYKNESELVSIGKTGEYKRDTHEINWTININVQGGLSLDGYEVTDSKFPTSIDDITFNPSSAKTGATLADGVLTFRDYSGSVTLQYSTSVDVSTAQADFVETNAVGIGNGTTTETAVTSVNVSVRNTMTKVSNQGNAAITNNKEYTKVLSWTSQITLDNNFLGKTYTDTLKQPTNGTHIITEAQLAAIQIQAKKEEGGIPVTLVAGTDFTATRNEDGKGFTITFDKGTVDAAGYNYLTISYNTTATANAPAADASYPITYVFGNEAVFNGITDKDNDWTLTRYNPESYEDLDLTVEKNWWNDTEATRPTSITTRILYSTNTDSTLRALRVASDGTYLYYGDEGYDAAAEEITLNSSNSWKKTFENLHKAVTKANENGDPGTTVRYYYKVEEVKIDGNPIENSLYEVNDGYYQVGYNNNHGVNYTTTISITNNYYKNRSVQPKKLWTGDTGTGTGFDSVTVQLEYSTDNGNTRYPVKMLNDEYIFDANGTTEGAVIVTQDLTAGENNDWTGTSWENLPTIIPVNGTPTTCTYYIRETAVTQTPAEDGAEANVITVNGTKFVTADGYYNVSNSVSDGALTVTNEFKKNVTYTVGALKQWTGDVYNVDSRPEVLLIQIQQSGNYGAWTAYGDDPDTADVDESIQEISAGNNWACSFADLPNQLANADGTVTTYRYRIVEVGYKMTSDSAAVMFPENTSSFATDENGVYNISYTNTAYGTNELSQSGTVTITNNFVPVATLSLTPQKKWSGDTDFESTDRPQSITFTLQRRLGYSGTWANVKENGNDVTVTLQNDANTTTATEQVWNTSTTQNEDVVTTYWNAATLPDLPAEVIARNADGSYTKQTCYYRFVETSYVPAGGGSAVTIDSGETSFSTKNGKYEIAFGEVFQTGTFTVINTFDESIGISKYILDEKAQPMDSTIEIEELVKFKKTINGEEYYVFNWLIEFETMDEQKASPVVDTLPPGFTLCEDTSYNAQEINLVNWNTASTTIYTPIDPQYEKAGKDGYYISPCVVWTGICADSLKLVDEQTVWRWSYRSAHTDEQYSDSTKIESSYYYDSANGKLYLTRPVLTSPPPPCFTYSTKIKCEDLDKLVENGSYTITNNAVRYDTKRNADETFEGVATDKTDSASLKITNPIDTNLITKSYSETKIPGNVQYSLNINPEGKNLSSGDTIDIQDLFETVSYTDRDVNNQVTNGKKLVDVLMSNIKLYEVDANGNKIELNSSDYTLMFQTGSDVSDGAALMQLTIPDEKHIVVDYTYKLIANETTPSVINGCKSSTRVNGRYVTMAPGLVPPAGDTIVFSNTASLKSDSANSSDSKLNTSYVVAKSSGTISTNALPSIKKVNTGDYSIDNLEATFLLARYENGKWYYVNEVEAVDEAKGEYDITWSSIGTDETRITADAARIEITKDSDFKAALEQDVLYKLVEIAVPADYEGSNLGLEPEQFEEMIRAYLNDGAVMYNGKDYNIFLNHYISTHYFTYNSTMNSYPDGITSGDVIQVKSGDDVEIPNNKLIDIDIDKQWVNPITTITDSKITVELYWSHTKYSGIPNYEDLTPANAEELGILDEDFSATKTITVTDGAVEDVWTDLPNGIDRKPIYYYIKEVAYEINGTVYTLTDGVYKAESGEQAPYLPTYSGNAANDDAVIGVRNSRQLMLKKEWKNSANIPMVNPPVDGVVVSIYGLDEDGVPSENPLFEGIELSVSNNWTADVTSLLTSGTDLSQYKSFMAVENENPDLEDYVVSCVFNLNEQTGEIIVTNKNTVPTEASVTVNKLWSDGNTLHADETIEVTLWRTQTNLTDLTGLASKLSLVNAEIMEIDGQECRVTLSAENEWTYTWTGLPLEDDSQKKYYYYVLENKSGIQDANKYTESYIVTDKTNTKTEYTVKNYRNAIVVEKLWMGEGNTELTADQLAALNVNSITLDVMKPGVPLKDSEDKFQPDGCHPDNTGYAAIANMFYNAIDSYYSQSGVTVPEEINIVALGDSITYGYKDTDYDQTVVPYPTTLTNLLTSDGYNLADDVVWNAGVSSQQVLYFTSNNNYGKITSETDIICLLGGTNDMHQSGSSVHSDPEAIYNRIKDLITTLRETAPNAVIFVGTIPYFDFIDDNGNITEGGGWWWDSGNKGGYSTLSAYADYCNSLIDQLNYGNPKNTSQKSIADLDEDFKNLYIVDTCQELKLIGDDVKVQDVTLDASTNWTAAVDIEDTDTSIKYYVNESDLPAGWTVAYTNNEQSVGSSTPITVTNTKYTPKTDLVITKNWMNDSSDTSLRSGIILDLFWSTDNVDWIPFTDKEPVLTVPDNDTEPWTYRYSDLPVEDTLGNTIYYMVEERPLDGYTVSYDTQIVKAEDDGDDENLELTNTRAISLNLKKIWSDGNGNHTSGDDKVTVRVFRVAAGNASQIPTETVDLVFQIADEAAVGVNQQTTLTANKTIKSAEYDADVVTVSWSGNELTITGGENEGTTTVTVYDENGVARQISVTVSALTMYLNGGTNFTIVAGQEYTLSVDKGTDKNVDAAFTITNPSTYPNLVTVDGTTIKANDINITDEKIKVTATFEGLKIEQEIIIELPGAFNITSTTNKTTIGNRIELEIDEDYGDFEWTSSAPSVVEIVEEDGKIYAVGRAVGSATITAVRTNDNTPNANDPAFTVTVENGDIFENSGVVVKLAVGETKTLTTSTSMQQLHQSDWQDSGIVNWSFSGGTITLEGEKAGTVTLVAHSSADYNTTATFTVVVYDPFAVTPATKTLEYGGTVTLTPNTTDTVNYTITEGNDLISISGNVVTANSTTGTAKITAKNTVTNEICNITISVVAEIPEVVTEFTSSTNSIPIESGKTIQSIALKLNNNRSWEYIVMKLDDNNYVKVGNNGNNSFTFEIQLGNSKLDNCNYDVDTTNGIITLTFKDNYQPTQITLQNHENSPTGTVTVTYASTSGFTLRTATSNLTSSAKLAKAESTASSDPIVLDSITFVPSTQYANTNIEQSEIDIELVNTAEQNFEAILNNLDVYVSGTDTPYYYWVEEVSTHTGYTDSYLYTDGDDTSTYWINASKFDSTTGGFEIQIENNEVAVEDEGVTMPSTGGQGTQWYYIIGMITMLGGAAGFIGLKLRQRSRS